VDPKYALTYSDLGGLYAAKGMLSEASAQYQEAVRLDPEFAGAYAGLGMVYRDLGRFDQSIEAFKKALELEPDNPTYLRYLTETNQRAEKHQPPSAMPKRQKPAHPLR
jgi:tetratricopeptide (TPR) repeat protein